MLGATPGLSSGTDSSCHKRRNAGAGPEGATTVRQLRGTVLTFTNDRSNIRTNVAELEGKFERVFDHERITLTAQRGLVYIAFANWPLP